jgi:hypothetical protein
MDRKSVSKFLVLTSLNPFIFSDLFFGAKQIGWAGSGSEEERCKKAKSLPDVHLSERQGDMTVHLREQKSPLTKAGFF